MKTLFFFFQLLLCILSYQNTFGQDELIGKIYDGTTKSSISYVNIIVNGGEYATISDLEGNFKLNVSSNINKITFKKVGYYQVEYRVTFTKDRIPLKRFLNIKLFRIQKDSVQKKQSLDSLTSNQLIDSILYHREKHDLENLTSYGYQKYQKSYIQLKNSDKIQIYGDSLRKIWSDSTQKKRTRKKALKTHKNLSYFLNYYLFLEESANKFYKIKPNYIQEKVESYRVSGFQKPNITSFIWQQKPINFYKNKINLYNKDFINPFSELGKQCYKFSVNDTLLAENDTWILVEFTPILEKKFNLLKGIVYLGQNDFALRSIEIEALTQKQNANIKLKQYYKQLEGKFLPNILQTQIISRREVVDIPLVLEQKIQFNNYQVNSQLNKQGFKKEIFELNKNHKNTEEANWLLYREKIDKISNQTYEHLDTTGKRYKFDTYAKITQLLLNKYYPISDKIDFDISQTNVNRHEGLRLGLGLITSPLWSSKYSGKAYLAYGFKDEIMKYGLSAKAEIWEKYQTNVEISFRKDVSEPANSNFWSIPYAKSTQFFRNSLTYRMDRSEDFSIFINSNPYHNLEIRLGLERRFIAPQYNYSFVHNVSISETKTYQSFVTSELSLQARYIFKRNTKQLRQRNYHFEETKPNISVQYKRGLSDFLGSNFEYHKILLEANYDYDWLQYGKSNFTLQLGSVSNNLPYPLLFNGRGSFELAYPLSAEKHFEVMPLYQFVNERFLNIFITHNLDKLLYFPRNQWFQPRFNIVQNMGFGSFNGDQTSQQNIVFDDMKFGYFETGIVAEDLLRISCFKVMNLNIGTGFFVRYGAYSSEDNLENIAFKLRANLNF